MDQMPNHVKCPEATPKHPAHQRVEAAKEPDAAALRISSAAGVCSCRLLPQRRSRQARPAGQAAASGGHVMESASNRGAAHLALLNHPQHMVRDICPGFGPHGLEEESSTQTVWGLSDWMQLGRRF